MFSANKILIPILEVKDNAIAVKNDFPHQIKNEDKITLSPLLTS